MVWDPKRVAPQGWDDVALFYRRIEERNDEFRPMRVLAEHILDKPYAAEIYAATSGTALLVTRHADADWVRDGLRIDIELSGTICLARPVRAPAQKPQLTRVDSATLTAAFEKCLRDPSWG